MASFNLETCARPNILKLKAYKSPREIHKPGCGKTFLDINENPHGPALPPNVASSDVVGDTRCSVKGAPDMTLATYPDPNQTELKQLFCNLRNRPASVRPLGGPVLTPLTPDNVHLGVGGSGVIDVAVRCFCVPGRDKILICPPTFFMYEMAADINDVGIVEVPLLVDDGFALDIDGILDALARDGESIKMVCLCSPNNPTGTTVARGDVARILGSAGWNGVVLVDETYVDFQAADAVNESPSLARWATGFPNLLVLQSLSKAFGLAAVRLGAAYTSAPIARLLMLASGPYNIPGPTGMLAREALMFGLDIMRANVARTAEQRARLLRDMPHVPGVGRLRGGVAGCFLLWEILDTMGRPSNDVAYRVCMLLAGNKGIVVRYKGEELGCEGCLRVTVGNEEQTARFLAGLVECITCIHGVALNDGRAAKQASTRQIGGISVAL